MKITIRLQDTSNGHVRVTFEPSLADMIKDRMRRKELEMTPAEAYAFVMAQAVQDASKKLSKYDPKRIVLPNEL